MQAKEVKKLGVIGGGLMGSGLGIVSTRHANVEVKIVGRSQKTLDWSADFYKKWVDKEISKGRLESAEGERISSLITWGNDM